MRSKASSSILTLFTAFALLAAFPAVRAAEDADEFPPDKKAPEGFVSLFDGTMKGWEGDKTFWSIQDGCITGRTTAEHPAPHSEYLIWQGEPVGDFILIADFRILSGNSGIEYRASKDEKRPFGLNGYQADICPGNIMGLLYGEGQGLGEIIAWRGQKATFDKDGKKMIEQFGNADEIAKSIKMNGWNTYRVEARGNVFTQYINDVKTSELVDERAKSPKEGIFGLQVHPGPPMFFQYKNIFLKKL